MLRKIRRGIFETNSSSTHSLTIVSAEDFEKWKNGELLFDKWSEVFVQKTDSNQDYEDLETYEQYMNEDYLETYRSTYTTKSGDKVIAFGKYGYDG
jgi:hypothetical protein